MAGAAALEGGGVRRRRSALHRGLEDRPEKSRSPKLRPRSASRLSDRSPSALLVRGLRTTSVTLTTDEIAVIAAARSRAMAREESS